MAVATRKDAGAKLTVKKTKKATVAVYNHNKGGRLHRWVAGSYSDRCKRCGIYRERQYGALGGFSGYVYYTYRAFIGAFRPCQPVQPNPSKS